MTTGNGRKLATTKAKPRCPWPGIETDIYAAYHDTEWGVPKLDDRALFEKLILEGFQAGLSWLTILRKRENFRAAFAGFDPESIARFDQDDVARLMNDTGIVRNRAKIEAAILNAKAFLAIAEKESFARLLWGFLEDGKPIQHRRTSFAEVPGRNAPFEAHVEGIESPRLPLRRPDDALRLHAIGRHGQRPPRHLPSPRTMCETAAAG